MRLFIVAIFLCSSLLSPATALLADDHWPQFRGWNNSGIGSGSPPVHWNVETGENVAWKTAIAGLGNSGPVVWGDRIFVTTAINKLNPRPKLGTGWLGGTGSAAADQGDWTWQLICLDRITGSTRWTRDLHQGTPTIQRHLKATHANSTPATNGECVVAFLGSEGLYCVNVDGEIRWKKDFGRLHSGPYDAPELEWGFGSSPVIHNNRVIVQCDCLNAQFVAVLDLMTGDEVLRIERNDVAGWSTPLVVKTDGGDQIVCNGFLEMAGYDLRTGERLWFIERGGDVPVPSPIRAQDLFILTNAHGRNPVYAVSTSATGRLTPTRDPDLPSGLAWWEPRAGSYIPTPLALDNLLYIGDDNGRLTVRRVSTGELVYRARIGTGAGNYTASAVAAAGRLYYTREDGDVFVIKAGTEYELLAHNRMHEITMATPAIAGDRLLIRTLSHVYCVAMKPDQAAQ